MPSDFAALGMKIHAANPTYGKESIQYWYISNIHESLGMRVR